MSYFFSAKRAVFGLGGGYTIGSFYLDAHASNPFVTASSHLPKQMSLYSSDDSTAATSDHQWWRRSSKVVGSLLGTSSSSSSSGSAYQGVGAPGNSLTQDLEASIHYLGAAGPVVLMVLAYCGGFWSLTGMTTSFVFDGNAGQRRYETVKSTIWK